MKTPKPLRVLQVAAEIYPLVKTGGLGDVMAALPPALARMGVDVRLLLPGLPAILDGLVQSKPVVSFGPAFSAATVVVRRGRLATVCVHTAAPVLGRNVHLLRTR